MTENTQSIFFVIKVKNQNTTKSLENIPIKKKTTGEFHFTLIIIE